MVVVLISVHITKTFILLSKMIVLIISCLLLKSSKNNKYRLKSVNSNFTLAVHSPKFGQAKTFCLILGGKKEKKIARPGFELMISRSVVNRANHYSFGPLLENQQTYLFKDTL